jgi:hypothetical protein
MKLSYLSIFLSATVIVSARPAVEAPQACSYQEADVAEPNTIHLRVDKSNATAKDLSHYFGVSCNQSDYRGSVLTRNTGVSFTPLSIRIAPYV